MYADRRGLALLAINAPAIWTGAHGSLLRVDHALRQPRGKYPPAPRGVCSHIHRRAGMGLGDISTVMNPLIFTKEHFDEMVAHVDSLAPLEACGLLAGKNSKVEKILTATNQLQSQTKYAMNPIEQLNAFEWIESNGLELLGIFHSHPTGPETVSPADVEQARYSVVYVVLSRAENSWRARGFWIAGGKFCETELQVI